MIPYSTIEFYCIFDSEEKRDYASLCRYQLPTNCHSLTFSINIARNVIFGYFWGTLKRLHGFVCSRADTVQSCGHAAFATVDERSDVGRLVLRKRLRSIAAAVGARRLGVAEAPTALHAEAPPRTRAVGDGPRAGKPMFILTVF